MNNLSVHPYTRFISETTEKIMKFCMGLEVIYTKISCTLNFGFY
jgi:hypothetical protein